MGIWSDHGISAWPYKKDTSTPAIAHGSGYGVGALNGYANDSFDLTWPPKVSSGRFAIPSAQPAPVSIASILENLASAAAQFAHSPPYLTEQPQ
ncbi:hypothetical protein KSW81_005211 [Nannochloris sp. 'desiccata']|nr:hypothetical protein KSW81_005211 [Chlorella desiccata (nom. nud.)]